MMEAATTIAPVQVRDAMPMLQEAPAPDQPQHMMALAHANQIRLARAAMKRSIKAGALDAAEVFKACPDEVATMTVSELLCSQKRWGKARARKFLTPLAIGENRALGKLTLRQRDEMAQRLDRLCSARTP
jgi:hypothetical protein